MCRIASNTLPAVHCEQYIASSPAATCQYKLMHSAAASRPRFKTIFCSRISGCYLSWCIYHPVSRFRMQHIGPKNADSWWEFRAQWKKSQDPTQWSADFGAMHTNLVSFTMTRQTRGLDSTPLNAHWGSPSSPIIVFFRGQIHDGGNKEEGKTTEGKTNLLWENLL